MTNFILCFSAFSHEYQKKTYMFSFHEDLLMFLLKKSQNLFKYLVLKKSNSRLDKVYDR